MEVIFEKLEGLLEKAEYLEQKTKHLSGENRLLKERVRELEQALETSNKDLRKVSDEVDTAKLATKLVGEAGNGDLEGLKGRIDKLIREIDQCIKVIGD